VTEANRAKTAAIHSQEVERREMHGGKMPSMEFSLIFNQMKSEIEGGVPKQAIALSEKIQKLGRILLPTKAIGLLREFLNSIRYYLRHKTMAQCMILCEPPIERLERLMAVSGTVITQVI